MRFDPFGIDEHHANIRDRISRGDPGLAQSIVGDVLVSYEVGQSITHGPVLDRTIQSILDEMIVDVARGEGIASPQTFSRTRIRFAIDDRREYPAHWTKKHAEADLLERFYFSGEGERLLR
ncbi:hypothetical protein T8K17_15925 [Thalassobaculum sp. OXR-137]|uniref:hypothetical protein n=1 Tax=Thalassobaculum sp. OXR-137 TaxID=3100173 RepID=UPI002AC96821|nr:hypothetical protein [Thalassobaculum sp. OXR-137]WPZ32728.1 hypothetical protein T8K17_15925 [Thalassobaculum sp. OXR-137]